MMNPTLILTVLLLIHSTLSFQATYPTVYEVSTRPFLYELTLKYGKVITLDDVDVLNVEFGMMKDMGYDVVWLMGMWHLGEAGLHFDRTDPGLLAHYAEVLPGFTQDDIIGSPYAITEYVVNPVIGTVQQLKVVRDILNKLGMKLMLDFVPNHSATDAPWTDDHVEYYVRDFNGTNPPYDSNKFNSKGIAYGSSGYGDFWKDTSQFNYWNMNLKNAQIENIETVASLADFVRCDMAHLLLNDLIERNWGQLVNSWGFQRPSSEFWYDAIKQVKGKYPVIFVAEVYAPNQQILQTLGFDFTYDKQLYDRLGAGNLDNLRGYIAGVPKEFHKHSLHFVENHDEPRAAEFFNGNTRADSAAIVSLTMPGMRLVNRGQEQGLFYRLDIHLRRSREEPNRQNVNDLYRQFLDEILSRDVFHNGDWTYLKVFGSNNDWRLTSWKFTTEKEKVLIIHNYSDQQGSGSILVDDITTHNGNDTVPLTELFSGVTYYRSANQLRNIGLFTIVDSWASQIFLYN